MAGSHVISVTGPVAVERLGVVDAHDHLFIDSPGMPGQAFTDVKRYDKANFVAVQLTELQKSAPGKYFEVKEKEHTCR